MARIDDLVEKCFGWVTAIWEAYNWKLVVISLIAIFYFAFKK